MEPISDTVPTPIPVPVRIQKSARILVFDTETAPLKAYVWSLWNQNVGYKHQLVSDWFFLSWSAKWLMEKEIYSDRLTAEEVKAEDDKRIVLSLRDLLDEADIVIAHNGEAFDVKKINTQFLNYRIKPPSPFLILDTLKHCRSAFKLTSNRLDYVANFLGLEGKMDTGGFELWKKCLEGCEESLEKMRTYCNKDVKLLEDVYLAIRPYMKFHPNISMFIEDDVTRCPACGSENLEWKGNYATKNNMYKAFQCNNCGAVGRSRTSDLGLLKRKNMVYSV